MSICIVWNIAANKSYKRKKLYTVNESFFIEIYSGMTLSHEFAALEEISSGKCQK